MLPDAGALAVGPYWYGGADYTVWKVKRGSIPSTANALPSGVSSVLFVDRYFLPGAAAPFRTQTVVGYSEQSITNNVNFGTAAATTDLGAQHGGRFTLGFWDSPDQNWGMEAVILFMGKGSDNLAGNAALNNSQFIIDTGFQQTDYEVDLTGETTPIRTYDVLAVRQVTSRVSGEASSSLFGSELNCRSKVVRIGNFDVGCVGGVRYLLFRDELSLRSDSSLTRPVGIEETDSEQTYSLSQNLTISSRDRVRISNHFYGAQVGFDLDSRWGDCFLYTRLKTGVGAMVQSANVEGSTEVRNNEPIRLTGPLAGTPTSPPSSTSAGGLLSGPNDTGRHTRTRIALLPEINVKLGYQFTNWLRGHVGYDFLYLNNAARAGGSTTINTLNTSVQAGQTNLNTNVAAPTFRFNDQNVTVQGINFGLEANF